MLFVSKEFVAFIAAVIAVYYICPKKLRWFVLLAASLFFYTMDDARNLIYLAVTGVTSWGLCLILEHITSDASKSIKKIKDKEKKKEFKSRVQRNKRIFMLLAVLIDLGILGFTKYADFVVSNVTTLFSHRMRVTDMFVPLGISFYTFKTVSYVLDVYRGTSKAEKNLLKLMLFVTYFPQAVQGPISRWNNLSATLFEGKNAGLKPFASGFIRIFWGYFKKVVIADRLVVPVMALTHDHASYQGAYVFVAILMYAMELYCDFTGGIDITIGISECLGIKVEENFILPYFSKNIKEYWNRWHITMGSWFTDYIFYPLSVSPRMLKLSKWSRSKLGNAFGKRVTVYISCFLVWLATGVWHGAAWNFIVWGLLNFVVIMISQELEPLYKKFHGRFHLKDKAWYGAFEMLRTFFLMGMIRMLDCYRNVPVTFKSLGSMFTSWHMKVFTDGSLLEIGLDLKEYILIGICAVVLFLVSLYRYRTGRELREKISGSPDLTFACCLVLLMITIVFGAYGKGYNTSQFIYNQF